MSKTIRFTVSDERYAELEKRAKDKGQGLQGYLRTLLFGGDDIYTPAVAYDRALDPEFKKKVMAKRVKVFELRDLYSESEWSVMTTGSAGALGKDFFEWVESHPGKLEYHDGGSNGKRARYKYI